MARGHVELSLAKGGFPELSQSSFPNPSTCLPQTVTFSHLTNFVLVWMVYRKDFP